MKNDHNDPIYNRAKGYFPLSVGTSIAIEALLGLETEDNVLINRNEPAPSKGVDSLWVNVSTVYRNFINAFEKDTYHSVDPALLAREYLRELEELYTLLHSEASNIKVVFYYSEYKELRNTFREALFREPKTPKQIEYENLRLAIMNFLLDVHKANRLSVPFVYTKESFYLSREIIKDPRENVVIMTHNPTDLWIRDRARNLRLLESFTGVLKPESEWNTKYYDGKNFPQIPFMRQLLPIFGDSEVFRPQKISVRRLVVEMSERHHWTILTTLDKVRSNIDRLPDSEEKKVLQSFFVLRA